LVGITVKAIRVYHERGILPGPDRDARAIAVTNLGSLRH